MKRAMLLGAVVTMIFAASALADQIGTVKMAHSGVSPYVSMIIWGRSYQGLGNVQTGLYHQTVYYNDAATTLAGKDVPTWGFCIEMQGSSSAKLTYNVLTLDQAPVNAGPGGSPMGSAKAGYINELWAEVLASIGVVGPGMTNIQAAAFQAAVWEIVYEDSATGDTTYGIGDWNVKVYDATDTMNSFKIDGNDTVEALANSWLALVDGSYTPLAKSLAAVSYYNAPTDYQDYLVQIPAPGAIALGLMGLGLVGWMKKRIG